MTASIFGDDSRTIKELRLIGALMLNDPIHDFLYSKIEASDFLQPMLRKTWLIMVELRKSMGEVSLNLVCGLFERDGVYRDADGIRRLFEYATSVSFVGAGFEAQSDWNELAKDRGNMLSIGGLNFVAHCVI